MSLLLDARKKAELALQQEGAKNKASGLELSLEDAAPRSAAGSSDTAFPAIAPSGDAPSGAAAPHAGNQRATGENLFKAKAAPARARMRLGFVPIILICGVVLTAAGSAYVWHEISPPTPIPPSRSAPPPPVAPAIPALAAVVSNDAPADDVLATDNESIAEPVAPKRKNSKAKTTSKKKNKPTSRRSATKSKQTAETEVAETQNDTAEGTRAIKIQRGPTSAALDPALLIAYQAYQSGDFTTAVQRYSEVLQRDTNNRDALLGLAAIAQQQLQDALAISYYKRILVLDPRDPVALAGLSGLPSGSDATGTESRLKSLLAQQPQTPDARSAALHFVLGNHYAAQSRWSDAQQSYFNAYNLEPGNAQLAFNLAVSLDHLQQTKLATQYYQRALQLDTSNGAGFDHAQAQQRIDALLAR